MLKSLLVKLAMLGATVALLFWIGWPMPDDPEPEESEGGTVAQPLPRPAPASPSPASTGTVPTGGAGQQDNGQAKIRAKLDVNRATAADLEQLPGIGPVLAQRIVEWRRQHGSFARVDDLNDVKGIGEKKLRELRPWVTVGQPKPPRASAPPPDALRKGQGKGADAQ
ncbi:MAG: ComEA family DNA-binding protein [Nitrospiraceae bacterium]